MAAKERTTISNCLSSTEGDHKEGALSATQLMAALETEVQFCASLPIEHQHAPAEYLAIQEREQKLERHLEEETALKKSKSVKQIHA